MQLTASHISYLHICHRKLWLYASGITMEHSSENVKIGKHIDESTYERESDKYKEIELSGSKIDRYDYKNATLHEVKKSSKFEQSHIAQVKYYIYLLKKNNLPITSAIIDYPKKRKTTTISMDDCSKEEIEDWINQVNNIIALELCPPVINKPYCKTCSYFEFCYSGE